MVTIETLNPLNPIQITESADNAVLILGGWQQNPERMADFQEALLAKGIGSAAFSGFDTIGPLLDEQVASMDEMVASLRAEDEFIASLPPRMILRALQALEITRPLLGSCVELWGRTPASVITHCAGANVYLLAKLLDGKGLHGGATELLPNRALLLEPMIAEGREVKSVAKENALHEKRAKTDPSCISLQSLSHREAKPLGMQGALPLGDILRSRGITLLGKATMEGLRSRVVVGHQDIAAPESIADDVTGLALDISVSRYPIDHEGPRYGHGYIFAQPELAAIFVVALLQKDAPHSPVPQS